MSTPQKQPSAKPHYQVRKILDTQFVTINDKVFIPVKGGVSILTNTYTRFINNSWYE